MSEEKRFNRGDRVRHPGRPEWGEGRVETAQAQAHQGKPAQRVVVTFANHGRVTLNTAYAPLQTVATEASEPSADATPPASTPGPGPTAPERPDAPRPPRSRGWLAEVERQKTAAATGKPHHDLAELPEATTDPFRSLAARLRATLELFRFDDSPRGLMDWAIAQSGLNDPLAEYARHELEQQFQTFARARQSHLRELLITAKRKGEMPAVDQMAAQLPQPLQAVLKRNRSKL